MIADCERGLFIQRVDYVRVVHGRQTLVTGTQAPTAASPDLQTTMANLKKYGDKRGLTALDPAQAVDQNAFAVTKDFASKHNLSTLSDLGKSGLSVSLAAPAECATRPFCKPGLSKTYGIKISSILPGKVAGVQAFRCGFQFMESPAIQKRLRILCARIKDTEGTDNRTQARKAAEAEGCEVDLLNGFGHIGIDFRKKSGQRPQVCSRRNAGLLIRNNAAKVVLQGTIYGVCDRHLNRARRRLTL